MDETSFFSTLWPIYLGLLPWLVAHVAGLVLVLVFLRRHPRPAWIVLIVTLASLVLLVSQPLVLNWILWRDRHDELASDQVSTWMGVSSTTFAVLHSVCWVTLVVAVFVGRSPSTRAVPGPLGRAGPDRIPTTVQPVSKGAWLGAMGATMLLSWLLVVPVFVFSSRGGEENLGTALACLLALWVLVLAQTVIVAFFVHRMWSAIQFGSPRTTPGKAVGFLFIPVYNFYWVFQAYWGWAVDYNRSVQAAAIRAPRAPEGLATTLCVLLLLSVVPPIGLVAQILLLVFASAALDGINAIAAASSTVPSEPR